MNSVQLRAAVIAVSALLTFAAAASARPGDLDTTFGSGGRVAQIFGDTTSGVGMAKQPDGKFLMCGGTGNNFVIARYNQDGTLDTSFSGGRVTAAFGFGATAEAIAIAPNGDIVVVGVTNLPNYDWAVAVFKPDGTPDTNFSGDGKLTQDFDSSSDFARTVAVTSTGTIVVAGSATILGDSDFAVGKWDLNGSPVTGFSGDGRVTMDFAGDGEDDYGSSLQALDDGTVVLAGTAKVANTTQVGIVRFLPLGIADSSFGPAHNGRVTFFPATSKYTTLGGMEPTADGKYVVGTHTRGITNTDPTGYMLARFNADGALDTTFGLGAGYTITKIVDEEPSADTMTSQPDGRFILAGDTPNGTGQFDQVIVRFNTDGTPDTSFGDQGRVINRLSSDDEVHDLELDSAGRIVTLTDTEAAPAGASLMRFIGQPVALSAALKSPSKSKLRAKKFRRLSGTAVGDDLTAVQVAILRTDAKLLKKKNRCQWIKSPRGSVKKVRAVKKKCANPYWLSATGTSAWSYKLAKALKPGRYKIYVRAAGTGGAFSALAKRSLTLTR